MKEQCLSLIRFLILQGKIRKRIKECLDAVNGGSTLSIATVKKNLSN